jgi:hypothetical protein
VRAAAIIAESERPRRRLLAVVIALNEPTALQTVTVAASVR